jgi:hypothetical protein
MSKALWEVEELQKIVAEFQAAKVGGVIVDAQSANLVASCFAQLDDEYKARWKAMPIEVVVAKLWKVMA